MLNLGFILPLEKILHYFFSTLQLRRQAALFKVTLYCLVLLKLIYYSIYYKLYFGEHSIVFSQSAQLRTWKDLALILYNSPDSMLPALFILLSAAGAFFGLTFKRFTFLPDLLIWFVMINLHHKVYPTLTGGDYLMNQFLFISCFLTFRNSSPTFLTDLRRLCHNMACIALYIQICFVYLISGLYKLGDAQWMNGSALSAISQIDYFSLYSAFRAKIWPPLHSLLTWFVVLYQILFAVLIWFKRIKKPLLIIGVLMHVYIGLVLGLVQFSLVMIAAYVFLWPAKGQNESK